MSCGVGRRRGLDPELLWLWCRPVATAPVRPLAWGPQYAMGVALEKTKKKKKVYTNEVWKGQTLQRLTLVGGIMNMDRYCNFFPSLKS